MKSIYINKRLIGLEKVKFTNMLTNTFEYELCVNLN